MLRHINQRCVCFLNDFLDLAEDRTSGCSNRVRAALRVQFQNQTFKVLCNCLGRWHVCLEAFGLNAKVTPEMCVNVSCISLF